MLFRLNIETDKGNFDSVVVQFLNEETARRSVDEPGDSGYQLLGIISALFNSIDPIVIKWTIGEKVISPLDSDTVIRSPFV